MALFLSGIVPGLMMGAALIVTWKVVLPAGTTGDTGKAVTVKSAACVPPTVNAPTVRSDVPVFAIVNVRTTVPPATTVLPKSV